MRKTLVILSMVVALATGFVVSPPLVEDAEAVHLGTVCKIFNGPDGGGGEEARVCAYINKHDFNGDLQAIGSGYGTGAHRFDLHYSYVKLVRDGTAVRNTGSYIRSIAPGEIFDLATNWYDNPKSGTWWSRIRVWVCFPALPNDPCSSVQVWNSQMHEE